MEFRVLDECVEIEGAGVLLFASQEDSEKLTQGCAIRDIRGNLHTVDSISIQEGLGSLFLHSGNAAYFQRLFRDIFVDATLFTAECTEGGD
jgi:arginine/lysine/ornithine decarboxylase